MITLTADGEQFAPDLHPVLEAVGQSGTSKADNHGLLPYRQPGLFTFP